MIRQARFVDVQAMAAMMQEAHARSIYRDLDEIDAPAMKRLFVSAVQQHGKPGEGGTCAFVAEPGGQVEGFIVGVLQRVYHVGKRLSASDLFFLTRPDADPRSAVGLLGAFLDWAEGNPKVVEIQMGATSALGDWRHAGRLYERRGLEQCGGIYRRSIER